MSLIDTPLERRTFIQGFLIAGPTLAIAARIQFSDQAQACPTRALVFGNLDDSSSKVAQQVNTTDRGYTLLAELGTKPAVLYIKKIEVTDV